MLHKVGSQATYIDLWLNQNNNGLNLTKVAQKVLAMYPTYGTLKKALARVHCHTNHLVKKHSWVPGIELEVKGAYMVHSSIKKVVKPVTTVVTQKYLVGLPSKYGVLASLSKR